eukprot:1106946-Amphidinium_carterae.1
METPQNRNSNRNSNASSGLHETTKSKNTHSDREHLKTQGPDSESTLGLPLMHSGHLRHDEDLVRQKPDSLSVHAQF